MKYFTNNELIDVVLFSKENRLKSYIKYRKLLWKIKKSTPDYNTLLIIYDFIDQLNFAYFHCLNNENHLFINNSRKKGSKIDDKSLLYKDDSFEMLLILKPDNYITLHIRRDMGYKETSITFKNGQAKLNNKLEEQLFINCTNLIMNELYLMVKKYRKFGRLNVWI